jgi:hypothetical protein
MANPSAESIASWSPQLRRLYDYWRGLHPVAGLPGRQHFDPLDIADMMPLLWMVDIVRSGVAIRFRYRLLGTRHVRAMGRDYTGWWVDEAHDAFLTSPVYAQYLQVAEGEVSRRRGRPVFHVHPDYYEMERLMLPLARDGENVDMALAMTLYFDRNGQLAG